MTDTPDTSAEAVKRLREDAAREKKNPRSCENTHPTYPCSKTCPCALRDMAIALATEGDALRAEVKRLRDMLRTIVSRAQDAKRRCTKGERVSAYNVASGILGQIGSDVAALTVPAPRHR